MHEYEFTLTNAKDAQNSIAVFGIADIEQPDSADAPPEWMAGYGWESRQKALVWAIADTLTPPPPGHVGVNVYRSPFEVQPGQTMSGFWFKTRLPPTSFTFYAQGFDTIPRTPEDYPDLFSIGVRGNIVVKGMAKNPSARDRK